MASRTNVSHLGERGSVRIHGEHCEWKIGLMIDRCQGKARTGKQCKNKAEPGHQFCKVHCFGHVQKDPWYRKAGFWWTIGAVLVPTVIAWFFYSIGPSAVKQDEILRIMQWMEAIQTEKAAHLGSTFPLGYILFTATQRKQVVPLGSPIEQVLQFDWNSGEHSVSLTPERIILKLPNFTARGTNGSKFISSGFTLDAPRIAGSQGGGIVLGNIRVGFEVIGTNDHAVMIAMGLQPTPERSMH